LLAETAIEVSTGVEIINEPTPEMFPDTALIVAVPTFIPVTVPEGATVTAPVGEPLHVTALVRFCVLPSV